MAEPQKPSIQAAPAAHPQRRHDREMPKVGDKVWYRLSSNMELVPAEVIDSIPTGNALQPTMALPMAHSGTVHLKVQLDPERHFSSGPVGYRRDAAEAETDDQGNVVRAENTFQRDEPDADEREWFATRQKELVMEQQIRARIAKGR